MRSKIVGLVLGASLLVATAVPSLACAFSTQASTDTQQQTAEAQPRQSTSTSTQ